MALHFHVCQCSNIQICNDVLLRYAWTVARIQQSPLCTSVGIPLGTPLGIPLCIPPIYLLPYLHSDAMLVWPTVEPMWRTDNKVYQPILLKANLLSCLSTAVGLMHEPSLPNGVVNPWQPGFGTKCGANGWWTGPHTHRCNTQLLGDIASHPQLRRQHHQLAHVGQPAANSRSHTKMISFRERTLVNVQHLQWGQQADIGQCATPSHTSIVQEDSALLPMGDTVNSIATIHSVPRGNVETMRNPTAKREVLISSQEGLATYQERCTRTNLSGCKILCSELCDSARGTEHCKCQGHLTLIVPGALNICGVMGTFDNCGISEQCLDWYRSGKSFIFLPWSPLQIGAGACLPSLSFIINDYLTTF